MQVVCDAKPVLASFDLHGVAEYIRKNRPKNVVCMVGAGVSVSAGIPDFRSPKTGALCALLLFHQNHLSCKHKQLACTWAVLEAALAVYCSCWWHASCSPTALQSPGSREHSHGTLLPPQASRCPNAGLYANLHKYDLPRPSAVFELDYFRDNPAPFFLLAKVFSSFIDALILYAFRCYQP